MVLYRRNCNDQASHSASSKQQQQSVKHKKFFILESVEHVNNRIKTNHPPFSMVFFKSLTFNIICSTVIFFFSFVFLFFLKGQLHVFNCILLGAVTISSNVCRVHCYKQQYYAMRSNKKNQECFVEKQPCINYARLSEKYTNRGQKRCHYESLTLKHHCPMNGL